MLKTLFLLLSVLSLAFSKELIATTYPVYYPLKYIVGERHRVELLIKSQADPHEYELTPKDIKKLAEANLVFSLGVENWEKYLLTELPKGKLVFLNQGIDLIKYGNFPDPHVWLSPKRYMMVVKNINSALIKWEPNERVHYESRYNSYMQKLKELDRKYQETLKNCEHRIIITTHRAWDYLAKDYNLKTVSLTGVHAEEEPKPSQIKLIIQTIRREGIKYIFAEIGQDEKVANFIANQTGAKVLFLNSSLFPQEPSDNYFSIMERNLRSLKEGLQCHPRK
ncbi:metal ABC transporter substrate-binding protein [Hydrogenobacter hydrogenophilus]|uniref:Zinc transport system substrate-binding protein n=1 Tax=Hydrogenobacter hydrogenophilus TaxID=35835 RepID=A0A285NVU1_9AQUI|nr:metal ABC transporter substrate-binding protein [Hydrogenobacter hydrogenophilus]SNZ13559.1 zinc transport system substrate-binding protein [Hydrogenobacter hydrogenophilus]